MNFNQVYNPQLFGKKIITRPNTCPFDTPQLIDRPPPGSSLTETDLEHLSHDAQPSCRVEGQRGLPQQLVRACSTWLTGRIEADTGFPYPGHQSSGARSECDRTVRIPGAGFKHQTCQTTNRDVGPRAIGINGDKGPVLHIKLRPLDEH